MVVHHYRGGNVVLNRVQTTTMRAHRMKSVCRIDVVNVPLTVSRIQVDASLFFEAVVVNGEKMEEDVEEEDDNMAIKSH